MSLTRRAFIGSLTTLAAGVVTAVKAEPVAEPVAEPIRLGTFHDKSFMGPYGGKIYFFEGGTIGDTVRVRLPQRYPVTR